MVSSIFLYGSRAREDHNPSSDIDLVGVTDNERITKPFEKLGLSFHVYPREWLLKQAEDGELFALHLVTEAVSIFDPNNFLQLLRESFIYKPSYSKVVSDAALILTAIGRVEDSSFTAKIRQRYFWALRTIIIGSAVSRRKPIFSAKQLEAESGIYGLRNHINQRLSEPAFECRRFGEEALDSEGVDVQIAASTSDLLAALRSSGGIAEDTARLLDSGENDQSPGLLFYL